jgi:hypothetical protein
MSLTNEEAHALNRRVAEALKWSGLESADAYIAECWPNGLPMGEAYFRITDHGGWFGWPPGTRMHQTEIGPEAPDKEPVPDFCRDAAAADLVRGFIESLDHGRLWIDERSYPHDFPRRGEQEGQRVRRYSCIIRGTGRETWQESFCETRGIALVLAFLKMRAADEAKAEKGGEE